MPPLTTEALSHYLGKKASVLLADPPFKHWTVTKSIEMDLDKPRVDYVFAQDGMDFVCDGDDRLETIFLYSDELRYFEVGVQDLPFSTSRQEVLARFGPPSKSGDKFRDPILGECGAWDRFARGGYTVHVEYRPDDSGIKRITLMRAHVVP